jgi:hypothetical protein
MVAPFSFPFSNGLLPVDTETMVDTRPSSAPNSRSSQSYHEEPLEEGPSTTTSTPNSSSSSSTIQVVVRLRPMNEYETKHGTLPVITAKTQDATVSVIKGKGRKQMKSSYRFDNVFTAFSTQEEVFEATVKPVILDVMRGFESTVFAYGQTGTGKTHTSESHITIMILLLSLFSSTYLMKLFTHTSLFSGGVIDQS